MNLTRSLLIICTIIISLKSCDEVWFGPEWSLKQIEAELGTAIPEDATAIEFNENDQRRYGNIYLSFEASPESTEEFNSAICNGILHSGYDPFASVNTGDPAPNSILIKDLNTHYSYSPDVPPSVFGNRCISPDGLYHQIRVDQEASNKYAVRFQQYSGCSGNEFPCTPLATYVNPIRDTDFPLMVIGVEEIADKYVLKYSEMCLEVRFDYPFRASDDQPDSLLPFVNSEVEIQIDGQPMPSAYISEDRQLEPDHLNGMNSGLFDYCLESVWSVGSHTMAITVQDLSGNSPELNWDFSVEE